MLHNRGSNLSLTTACGAVVVVTVSLLQVLPIPLPKLSALEGNTHNATRILLHLCAKLHLAV